METSLSDYSKETLTDKMIIVSSDFMRTRETAEIVHQHFSIKTPLRFDTRLRERNMGNYDLKSVDNYYSTVALDQGNPTHTEAGVESVTNMILRMTHVICDLDKEFADKIIVLVSHGDPLICVYAICCGVSPCERYNKLSPFYNCDVREINCLQS